MGYLYGISFVVLGLSALALAVRSGAGRGCGVGCVFSLHSFGAGMPKLLLLLMKISWSRCDTPSPSVHPLLSFSPCLAY